MDCKDTKAAIGDLQIPQVDAKVICGQISLTIAVDRDGVDVVGVSIRKHSSGAGLHHQVHGPEHWHLRGGRISISFLIEENKVLVSIVTVQIITNFWDCISTEWVKHEHTTDSVNLTFNNGRDIFSADLSIYTHP